MDDVGPADGPVVEVQTIDQRLSQAAVDTVEQPREVDRRIRDRHVRSVDRRNDAGRTHVRRSDIGVANVDGDQTRVLVEQMGAVDVTRLGYRAGHLNPAVMWGIDLALETVRELS